MPRPRHLWLGVLAAVVVLALAGGLVVDRLLELALRKPVNAYLRARTLELVRAAEDGTLDIAVPRANLHLLRRVLVLEGIRVRYERAERGRLRRLEARTPRVELTGVVLWDVVRGRDFRLRGARITRPVILLDDLRLAPDTAGAAAPAPADTLADLPAPDSLLFYTVRSWLPGEMHGSRIEDLRVSDGTVALRRVAGGDRTTDSIAGIDVRLQGVSVDSLHERVFERAHLRVAHLLHAGPAAADSLVGDSLVLEVNADDTLLTITRARTAVLPGAHGLQLAGLHRSQARRTLTVDTLAWQPAGADSTFFSHAPARSTRVRAVATGITVMGLPPDAVRRRRLLAGGAWVQGVDLDVLADRRGDGIPPRRILWPTRLAGLDWLVGADSVHLEEGRIRYAELQPDAGRAGEVSFTAVRARILNATNEPSATATPMTLEAAALLYGEAPLSVRIQVPVRPGPLNATVTGETGSMPLTTFNRFLGPADGMTISGGTLHAARFRFTFRNGQARGRFQASWEGLGLRKVDPRTGTQDLGDRLVTLFANVVTREDNLPGDDGRLPGDRIKYRLKPTDTFWGALWRALRSGIVNAVRE